MTPHTPPRYMRLNDWIVCLIGVAIVAGMSLL